METFSIELSIQEANLILGALGQLPYARVHDLISSIREQANAQLNGGNNLGNAIETAVPENEMVNV